MTRGDFSTGAPSAELQLTTLLSAMIVFLVQQHPLPRVWAAASRTHSLRSLRSAPTRASSASGQ